MLTRCLQNRIVSPRRGSRRLVNAKPLGISSQQAGWLALAVLVACSPSSTGALVPPADEGNSVSAREFSMPALEALPTLDFYRSDASALKERPELASFFAETPGSWEVRMDTRNDRPHLIQGSGVALLPGRGNDLTFDSLPLEALPEAGSSLGPSSERPLQLADVERLLRRFLAEHDVLDLDHLELRLDEQASLQYGDDGYYWTVRLQQFHQGVPVDAHVFFRINHGNLVQFGANRVAEVFLDPRPSLGGDEALENALASLGLEAPAEIAEAGTLEIWPVLETGEPVNERYVGQPGSGYGHRLLWKHRFHLQQDGELFQVLTDAHTEEILEFKNLTAYAKVEAQIYPKTNTDALVTVGLPSAEVQNNGLKVTDDSGNYNYTGGAATVTLDGSLININDSCGLLSLTDSVTGNLDLGGASGTDCATPGYGGGGNTHASRSGFYHLTRLHRKAAGFLPTNAWLNSTLTANMNLNDTCNAFWNGTTVNFFRSGDGCSNTGELAAVFLHEWGHGMDWNDGTGAPPENGTGEAMADTFAFLETQDSCIGQNFRPGVPCHNCSSSCTGVRELAAFAKGGSATIARPDTVTSDSGIDCDRGTLTCPYSTPNGYPYRGPMGYQGHCESHIASTANWDLTQSLIARRGPAVGWASMERLWFGAIPQTESAYRVASGGQCNPAAQVDGCAADNWYTVLMAMDDNDGNLANGTPNGCAIWDAFNDHGIACGSRPPCSKDIGLEVGSTTYREPGQEPRVFAFVPKVDDQKLGLNFWKHPQWAWRNQEQFGTVPVAGKPAVVNFRALGQPRNIHAFVGSPSGRLTSNDWNGSAWLWRDHGQPQSASGPASAMVGSPGAISFQQGAGSQEIHAFLGGQGPGLAPEINLFTRFRNAWGWQWLNLGRPSGLTGIHGTPGVITYRDDSQFQRIYAFVRGSDGGLHLKFRKSSGWQPWNNPGKPPGTFMAGSPAVVTHRASTFVPQQIHAFVASGNGSLFRYFWNGTAWQWQGLGKPFGTTVSGSPGAVTYREGLLGADQISVFVRGVDGNLHRRHFNGTSWQWSNRGAPEGTTVAVGSTPAVTTITGADGKRSVHVFVRGTDGRLYVYRQKGSSWLWADQGLPVD